jgi:acetate kinase
MIEMNTILVVNAGSSSVKFQLYKADASNRIERLVKGSIDGVGTRPRLRGEGADGKCLIDRSFEAKEIADIPAAMQAAALWLREAQKLEPSAVGHRVVHGGPNYDRPMLIDYTVLAELERYVPLAPLHQPNNLAPIRAIRARFPGLPQVACFDTAFHRGHGPVVDHFAIPERFYAEGVRRYGFHGLSYEFIAERLQTIAPDIGRGRVVVAHLGSGASMCALLGGRSIESTMGFTALDGLPMGTRPGQIDPGVLLYLIQQKGMDVAAVEDLLYRDSGLKGISGVSNDMRELLASTSQGASLAIDYFVYRVSLHAGMLAAALGGLDAFVFTAGVGEKSAVIRTRIAEKLGWLGADLDHAANDAASTIISTPRSRLALCVVPTDEELMIARHTLAVVSECGARRDGTGAHPQGDEALGMKK